MAKINRYGKNAWKINLLNWAIRLVILGIVVGILFFGYTKLQPVISEKIEEWKTRADSDEEDAESGEENNGIGTALPGERNLNPVYLWDFSVGMEEQAAGVPCTPYGDVQIVGIDDPNAPVTSALYLDGDEDYIDCGREIQFSGDFTVNALVYCEDVYKDYTAIIGKYETEDGPFVLSIRQGHVNCWVISDSYHDDFESETELMANTWYDITVVCENSQMRIYINGMLDGQADVGQLNVNEDTVTIGRQAALYKPDQYQFKGYIGRIGIYNIAMTKEELVELAVENLQLNREGETGPLMSVTAGALNVRSEPHTGGDILTTLQSGEKVELLDDPSKDWVYIRCIEQNNEEGYVSSKYLTTVEGE